MHPVLGTAQKMAVCNSITELSPRLFLWYEIDQIFNNHNNSKLSNFVPSKNISKLSAHSELEFWLGLSSTPTQIHYSEKKMFQDSAVVGQATKRCIELSIFGCF